MASDQTFSKTRDLGQPLLRFLRQGHALFVAEPARLLGPLIDFLDGHHCSGKAHGAVIPSRIRVFSSGEIDIGFLREKAEFPDQEELAIYYPGGIGLSVEEDKRRDLQALAGVIHLIVTDQPPARQERRAHRLAEHRDAKGWPAAFIELVDRLLEPEPEPGFPTLKEISASLGTVTPATAGTATSAEAAPDPGVPEAEPFSPAVVEIPVSTASTPASTAPADTPPAAPAAPALEAIRLPNGMVGRGYSAEMATVPGKGLLPLARIAALSELPPGLDLEEAMLCGTPQAAGEFKLRLRFHPAVPDPERPAFLDRALALTINPDPQSLWKNTPSDRSDRYWKEDAVSESLPEGPLAVMGASLRGRSHAHVGGFRDDDMAMAWFPGACWYSLTVADGAGSSKCSRRGSKVACDTVRAHFEAYFAAGAEHELTRLADSFAEEPDDPAAASGIRAELYTQFGTAAMDARKALEGEAAAADAAARDFHTTLITALVHPLSGGGWFVAAFSIGDGAAALVGVPGGEPCLLTRPDGGEFAGQTMFLTMKEALGSWEAITARIRMAVVPSFDALLLVTDGISDPRFDSENALSDPAAWDALWTELRGACSASAPGAAPAAILEWMGFHSPGHHDDRTIVLAAPPRLFTSA